MTEEKLSFPKNAFSLPLTWCACLSNTHILALKNQSHQISFKIFNMVIFWQMQTLS